MATFSLSSVRTAARQAVASKSRVYQKSSAMILNEAVQAQFTDKVYDIFLSHAFSDADIILGVKTKLEEFGYSVYVDWIDDPQLDRSKVTSATAEALRLRMGFCRSLLYATTPSCSESKWMPWECGYVDGKKRKVSDSSSDE